jgi:hypothetical protein
MNSSNNKECIEKISRIESKKRVGDIILVNAAQAGTPMTVNSGRVSSLLGSWPLLLLGEKQMEVIPKPEFLELTEEDVLCELQQESPDNEICHEVTRLVSDYAVNFTERWKRLGEIPQSIVGQKPNSGIETVAQSLFALLVQRRLENSREKAGGKNLS